MKRIFFLGQDSNRAHYFAEQIGFKRGEYVALMSRDPMRGLRDVTLFVVGDAQLNEAYNEVMGDACMHDYEIIYIDDDLLKAVA